MRKWVCMFLVLALLSVFSLGCAGVSKEKKIRCPKCGDVFSVEEGQRKMEKKGP